LAAGLLRPDLFSGVLVAVVLTTVVAPYLLAYAVPRAIAERQHAQDRQRAQDRHDAAHGGGA
jgi:hypothetical protein